MNKIEIITTQYVDGNPEGIRVCRRMLSAMTTLVIPRHLLADAKKLENLPLRGIYYLIDEEDGALARVYVGQTSQGILRLDVHKAKKDFWNKAIMFLADDDVFSLDLISALEKYGIEKAQKSQRYTVENKANPKYHINQSQKVLVGKVFEEIEFMMASLGYTLDSPIVSVAQDGLLYTHRRGIRAMGVYKDRFTVLKGSVIDMTTEPKETIYTRLRQNLVDSGDLVESDERVWTLKKSIEFKSPSGAADFVLGGSNNGWVEWRDRAGRSMSELYRE
ncbi:GIY-YIG nuclease family protein [Bifidobacterium sp. ESL0775]|uniref:GIY-YIG nuclease family protein n=1 Tax=Bifidobacterium sp. ESL0775 TaxID=2983230 RepID=UPI0023FA0076|nr:GIY-YIG nuclease family protein [Bifidobacterium sp. ESL0775]WEV68918.1 GIY-YIG nuclease family protein [Bifidobacterium sp. ESL0775]